MHATVLTWLAIVWHAQIEFHQDEGDNHPNSTNFMQKLMDLRGQIGAVRLELDYSDPEVTRGMMYMVTYLLLFFVMLGLPLQFYVKGQCFQWQCITVSVSEIVMYHGLLVMQDILARSPFDIMGECVNMDYLLCGGEKMIFHMIRAGYDPQDHKAKTNGAHPPENVERCESSIYAHPRKREDDDDDDDDAGSDEKPDVPPDDPPDRNQVHPHNGVEPAPPTQAPPILLQTSYENEDANCKLSGCILPAMNVPNAIT
jgi:hypothetical protein